MQSHKTFRAYVGLGNAGKEYRHTYHNIGALAVERFADWAAEAGKEGLLFQGPAGFMNQSGFQIIPWLKRHNIAPEDFLIVHDDSDLLVGDYKIAFGGGSAGHNGVASLISALGHEQFWRLRIGIRNPDEPVRRKAIDFVLKRYGLKEKIAFAEVFKRAWLELSSREN